MPQVIVNKQKWKEAIEEGLELSRELAKQVLSHRVQLCDPKPLGLPNRSDQLRETSVESHGATLGGREGSIEVPMKMVTKALGTLGPGWTSQSPINGCDAGQRNANRHYRKRPRSARCGLQRPEEPSFRKFDSRD